MLSGYEALFFRLVVQVLSCKPPSGPPRESVSTDNLRWGCTCSKHGLSMVGVLTPGVLVRRIRKTMLIKCEVHGPLEQ